MTSIEFDQWWADFKAKFPDLGGPWFAKNRTPEMQRSILANWAEVLRDVTLAEATKVNRGMLSGDLDGFGGEWDRDKIATKVRTHAINARRPSNWTGPDEDPYPQPKSEKTNLGGSLKELIDMQEAGATSQQCDEFLRKRFPAARADRQPRFKCVECLDTGRVEVWHWERVHLAKRDGIEAGLASPYKTAAMACSCNLGDKFTAREIPLVRFDDRKHCLATGGDVESERAVATFTEWLATCDDVSKRPNYVLAFEQGAF